MWQSIRIVINEMDQKIQIFWNKILIGTVDIKISVQNQFSKQTTLMHNFEGEIAEITIFSKQLDDKEIENKYTYPLP